MADHAVERLAKLGQTKRICCSAAEYKINVAIDFKNLPDTAAHLRSPFVLTVSGRIIFIRFLESGPGLWTNRRRIIAGTVVTSCIGTHYGSIRVFCRLTISTRNCLTAEPWASESARQIPFLLAPRIAFSSFIFYFVASMPGE